MKHKILGYFFHKTKTTKITVCYVSFTAGLLEGSYRNETCGDDPKDCIKTNTTHGDGPFKGLLLQ
jgi:hypothetical protein